MPSYDKRCQLYEYTIYQTFDYRLHVIRGTQYTTITSQTVVYIYSLCIFQSNQIVIKSCDDNLGALAKIRFKQEMRWHCSFLQLTSP